MRRKLLASGVVIAVIVGVLVAKSIETVDAQSPMRLSLIAAGNRMGFISDSKSGGCWLAKFGGNGQASFEAIVQLAPAPAAACK